MLSGASRRVGLWLVLGIGCAFGTEAQDVARKSTVRMTVQVLGAGTAEGKRLPQAKEFQDGVPVVSLARPDSDATMQVVANSFVVVRADRRVTITVDRKDVLEGMERISLPRGVRGIFRAKKAGTAVVTLTDADLRPSCPPGINCDSDWSGYILTGSAPYTGISGQWTVPTLASNSPQGNSSSWVGIGGNGPNTLIQAGTAQDFGSFLKPWQGTSYFAWYQLLPALQVIVSNKPVSPGDVVQVTIAPSPGQQTPVSGKPSQWLIQISNLTQKWVYSTTQTYSGDLGSAEWIMESPEYPDTPTRLPNYQQIEFNFDDRVATGGGALGPPKFAKGDEIWLNQDGANGIFSTPSNPSGDGKGFYVTWTSGAANQVFPPGPWIQTMSLPPALLGQPYSQTIQVNQAASPTWTFSGYLPGGVRFNQLTGVLAGTPTINGDFMFSVYATDKTNGSASAVQPLTLSVLKTAASSLQVDCTEVGPKAPPAINITVDGVAEPCGTAFNLATGLHQVVGAPVGTGPFKVTYAGSCSSSGQVTLTQGVSATCAVTAETLSGSQNSCPVQQHCCEPGANGCLKCIPNKLSCP